ncbi:MAG TPA: lipid II flippase MurJ [Jatrophihabitantaceae bacterium]|nr:lipid II flippase MurJ [Jatrophihabitantaceae bacterium]
MSVPAARSLARAAAVIAVLTVLARLAGFVRTAVFSRAVGPGCVGSVYQTANTIPNIIFDIIAGGTLAALVVPVLAPAMAGGRHADVYHVVSALLTWTLVILVPVAVLIAALAEPIVRLLLGENVCPGAVSLGTRMLVVFSVQVVFYGIGIVLGGVLVAGERFAWPALAPLLSSLTVIGAYLWYGALAGTGRTAEGLPRDAELVLSVGTTLGVVVLALCQLPAVLRTRVLRWRPTLRFPDGIAPRVRVAAIAGAATLASMQISTAVMIRLANDDTPTGTLVVLVLAQTVYLLPWAVLSFPIATASFPRLAAAWEAEQHAEYRDRLATATRIVIAVSAAGAALLIAAAVPARVVLLAQGAHSADQFAPAVYAFALGLVGWSLVAVLARALYAATATAASAAAQVTGQLVVIVADLLLSVALPAHDRAFALALGNSIGVVVATVALVGVAVRRGLLDVGPVGRHVATASVAAAAGALAGWAIGRRAGTSVAGAVLLGAAASVVAVLVFTGVLFVTDRDVVRELRARVSL